MSVKPKAFVAENVAALTSKKFVGYLEKEILKPLRTEYKINTFELKAEDFGVPQKRKRIFIIGFMNPKLFDKFKPPSPTHSPKHLFP